MSDELNSVLEINESNKSDGANEPNTELEDTLKWIAWLLIIIGTIAALIVINSLTIEVPYYTISGSHTEPHPYRWYISFGILLATAVPSVYLLSIAKIIILLSKIHITLSQQTNEIK